MSFFHTISQQSLCMYILEPKCVQHPGEEEEEERQRNTLTQFAVQHKKGNF